MNTLMIVFNNASVITLPKKAFQHSRTNRRPSDRALYVSLKVLLNSLLKNKDTMGEFIDCRVSTQQVIRELIGCGVSTQQVYA